MIKNKKRHKGCGKSKIEIKYIQDDRRRHDTLYKRRRGIIKKVHELGVVCGLKISLVATDFTNICFTYSNDHRVDPNLTHIFKKVRKPIWLTDFSELEYPYKSVKKENRIKLLQGHRIGRSENDYPKLLNNSDFLEESLDLMGKRLASESGTDVCADFYQAPTDLRAMNSQVAQRSKLLKISKLELTQSTHLGPNKEEAQGVSTSSKASTSNAIQANMG